MVNIDSRPGDFFVELLHIRGQMSLLTGRPRELCQSYISGMTLLLERFLVSPMFTDPIRALAIFFTQLDKRTSFVKFKIIMIEIKLITQIKMLYDIILAPCNDIKHNIAFYCTESFNENDTFSASNFLQRCYKFFAIFTFYV